MDTLSLVSKYLNDLEEYLDDGDSLEARKLTVGKSKEELELFEALEHKSIMIKEGKHKIVVFTKAPPRTYSKPFTSFSLPYDNDLEEYLDDGDSLEARKLTVGKSKEELELFEALEHKSIMIKEGEHKIVVFTKAPLCTYSNPFTRFSLPCDVDGQGAWDAELDMADSFNYITEESKVDHGIGEICINLTMLEKEKEFDAMLEGLVEKVEEIEIPQISSIAPPPPPPPIYHLLSQNQKDKVNEALDQKFKELEESKPILEVLENYMTYRKKLDEVMMGRARFSSDEFSKEEKMKIVEHGLPKKMCDPGNFVLLVRVNGTVEMGALADTRQV
ncbi:hypothetical protein Tco_0976249 [Tanacetum coccineum]|uniref:Uncharacterized protein n=1 Tax=Tanacetum coccineum TaxID=301880 RepID=A0ABQ5EH50_9ASTR